MKIFISSDMEGTAGLVSWDECLQGGEYERGRVYMTNEVSAAAQGAFLAGADEVIVKDAHERGRNIIIDNLPEEVRLIRGWIGHPFMMLDGLDATYDGVIFTGYHSGAGLGGNTLAHTINGSDIQEIRINGRKASECLIYCYAASYIGVPVIYVSGDKNLIEEVEGHNLGIETLVVKEGRGGAAISLSPKKVNKLIEEGVAKAVKNIPNIKPIELPKEFYLEITFKREALAVKGSFYPDMERRSPYEIGGSFTDYFDLLKALMFLI